MSYLIEEGANGGRRLKACFPCFEVLTGALSADISCQIQDAEQDQDKTVAPGINLGKYRSFGTYSKGVFRTSLITSFPEIASSKSCTKRLIKILVFVGCTIGFSYQTLNFLNMYFAYPTVVNVQISYPFKVEQPGITLCNSNRLRRTFVCTGEDNNCNYLLPVIFCKLYPKFCPGNRSENAFTKMPYLNEIAETDYYWPFNKEVAHNTSMLKACTKVISILINPCKVPYTAVPAVNLIGEPNYCYSVESQWGEPNAQPERYPNFFTMQFQLNTQPEEYVLYSSPTRMQMALHDRKARINPYVNGYMLAAGTQYMAHVSMISKERLPYPYDTNCTDYLKVWRKNNGTGPLNEMMCVEQCKMNKLLKIDSCVDKTVAYPHEEQLCPKNLIMVTSDILESCYFECGNACNDVSYEVRLEDIGNFDHMCPEDDVWCKNQLIKLDLNFLRFCLTEYVYQPKFASIEMFSYVGGYMGMWLGLSLISIFDLFQTICYLLFYPIGRMARKRQKKMKTSTHHFGRRFYDNLSAMY